MQLVGTQLVVAEGLCRVWHLQCETTSDQQKKLPTDRCRACEMACKLHSGKVEIKHHKCSACKTINTWLRRLCHHATLPSYPRTGTLC
jgi:hypothetical protein